MRRATAWVVVVGVAVLGSARPASAEDGFWVSIASGVAGSASPTGYQEWWFETPHGPPPVAVTGLSAGTVEAHTGGGSSFFTGGALPVVLPTTDGYAYLASGNKPDALGEALKRQTAGGRGLASAAPDASATAPPDKAVLLTAELSEPDAGGARTLKVTTTDGLLVPLGEGKVNVADGGWWVIGLGPGAKDGGPVEPGPIDPTPVDPTPVDPTPVDPVPVDPPGGGGGSTGGPVATPEPATALLLGIGGLTAAGWRAVRRRSAAPAN